MIELNRILLEELCHGHVNIAKEDTDISCNVFAIPVNITQNNYNNNLLYCLNSFS